LTIAWECDRYETLSIDDNFNFPKEGLC